MKTLTALLTLVLLSAGLRAQSASPVKFPAASPPATLKQQVGVTDVEISYSRPSMRGREIFGGLVAYGEVWRTGANHATKISFSTPVTLNGTEVPAGSYELFTIPGEDEWTVILQEPQSQWGAYAYDPKHDVARVTAKPETLEKPVETFTIGVGNLRNEGGTLQLSWDRTRVPVEIEVDLEKTLVPQIEAVMNSDAEQKPYAQAAMFYFEQGLDVKQAEAWMVQALEQNPEAFYFHYHHARMLAKLGRTDEAIAAAERSLAGAEQAGGSLRDEYVRLNEALLEKLR